MDGLFGLLVAALIWLLPTILGYLNRERAKSAGASSPPQPSVPQERSAVEIALRRARAALASLEKAKVLEAAAPLAELDAVVRTSLEEARVLTSRLAEAEADAPGSADAAAGLAARAAAVHERAGLLLRLLEGRLDPSTSKLLRELGTAVESAVPDLGRRVVVLRGGDHERGRLSLGDARILLLVLAGQPRERPWSLAALIEDAWAASLLGTAGSIEAAGERAADLADDGDAMGRFSSALANAWAPALLLDAACMLSLGGGHAARVRALAMEEDPSELFLVGLDAQQRVDSVPPVGLRLLLLRRLLERSGGEAAAPLPPRPVLHLRGPGILDQVALPPVLAHAACVQAAFADALSARDGLQDPAGIERQARALLTSAAGDPIQVPPQARVLFSAFGLCATLPGEPETVDRLLAALAAPSRTTRGRTAAVASLPRPTPAATPPRSRARVLADAVLLGQAFSRPST